MEKIFNNEQVDVLGAINLIREELNGVAPFVQVQKAAMGNSMIMLLISFEPKTEWHYGYVENSNYMRISIEQNGVVECFTQSLYKKGGRNTFEGRLPIKLRKFTAKTLDKAIEKLSQHFDKVKDGLE